MFSLGCQCQPALDKILESVVDGVMLHKVEGLKNEHSMTASHSIESMTTHQISVKNGFPDRTKSQLGRD